MPVKQVIVMRKDLNMRKGKMAAQASHASMKVFFDRLNFEAKDDETKVEYYQIHFTQEEQEWLKGSFTKIVVSVDSEQQLLDIYNKAKDSGLNCGLITDSGLTEFNGVATLTCCSIGPNENNKIDLITKDLPLL